MNSSVKILQLGIIIVIVGACVWRASSIQRAGMDLSRESAVYQSNLGDELSTAVFDVYSNAIINGSEVFYALKKYGEEVTIRIETETCTSGFGADEISTNPSSAFYVSNKGRFRSKVENDNGTITLIFTQ